MLFRLSRGTCYRELRFSRTPDKSGNPNQLAVTQRNGRSDGNPHDCQPGYESNGAHRGELSIPHPCDAVGGHDQLALAFLLHFRFPPNDLKLSRSAEIGKAASSMGPSCRSASSGRRRSPPPPPVSNRDCLPRWSCWSRTRVRASRRRVRHGCCRSGRSPPGS